ncbi:YdhK family protein [Dietzia aurantiaca]|uniref:YdhK family protein n=1 Tax=Dietzia aurantiaca TaxID=983873 RepID=UPI001E55202D|nr:YdhK family protein [Dietzia aurantiaca]MCD2262288.1 YdhK family protein [Dietzia aurantiaca]
MNRQTALAAVALASALALSACGSDTAETGEATATETSSSSDHTGHGTEAAPSDDTEHDAHQHPADGGPAPEGIAEAGDPAFPVGTDVVLAADHMPGMDGAAATVSGAFDTTTYSVTYTPTDGGEPVVDHKWVVHEELENPGPAPLPDGTEVVLRAAHMPGMDGATATIDSSTQETVYMVDVHSENMTMTNHKWVTESEIRPAD